MKILSVGPLKGRSNTCTHRHWALCKIANYIDSVSTNEKKISLWYRLAYHLFLYGIPLRVPENNGENQRIKKLIDENQYDVVWIDKGITIFPETLKYIKQVQPDCRIISYSPDNMALRHNQSQQYLECIPLYDYIVTNKSYILDDMKKLGARNIQFVNNSFEPSFHYPRELSEQDKKRIGGDVGFVGMWEKERCESILYLTDHGIKVRVFGDKKWKKYQNYNSNLTIEVGGLFSDDYAKSFQAFKISLCFLRKMNFDQQTTRSVEIPACGGFMLAERTNEHMQLFKEGKEAAFFSSNEELLEKCRYYLYHEDERLEIAKKGLERCINSNYSNEGVIQNVLKLIFQHDIKK